MVALYPTHPEPGDPPGFYGEVHFDGQKVTDRRKPGADPSHIQMTDWYVPTDIDADGGAPPNPSEPAAPVRSTDLVTRIDAGPGISTTLKISVAGSSSVEGDSPAPTTFPEATTPSAEATSPRSALPPTSPPPDAPSPTPSPPVSPAPDGPPPDASSSRISATEILALYDAVRTALQKCPTDIALYDEFDDETVRQLHRKNAEISRLSGIRMAISADQIAQRSAVELAGKGMARQFGDRTPIEMAKNLGGLTQQEAMAAINAGHMMRDEQANAPEIDISTDPTDPSAPTPPPAKRPAPPPGPSEPWLAVVSRALTADEISRAQSEAIRTGLGKPTEGIPVAVLADAAEQLLAEGRTMTPERLAKLARQTRDRLDREGVALRETERRGMRSAKIFQRADGMMQLTWLMDPELGMQVKTLCDRITSPKTGGPRVGDADAETVRRITDDPRSPQQILSDNLIHLLEVGATVDPSNILATPTASVVVLTTRRTKTDADPSASTRTRQTSDARSTKQSRREGGRRHDGWEDSPHRNGSPHQENTPQHDDRPRQHNGLPDPHDHKVEHFPTGQYDLGWINGHPDPLSPETVDRLVCGGGTTDVNFTEERVPLDVSSEQRLFNKKQRVALGAQFGGCGWVDEYGNPTCERPPTWCEAHHVEHWYRDNGKTVMSNGYLLCKSHHLQLHNDHWEIIRRGPDFWLIPPLEVDPAQTPRQMRRNSDAYRDLTNTALA